MSDLSRTRIARRLLSFGRPLLPVLGISTLARVLGLVCGIALLGIGAWGVGRVLTEGGPVGDIVVFLVVLSLAKGILRYIEQYAGHYVAFRLLAMVRDEFYRRIEPLAPAATVRDEHSGDLLARATKDIGRIEVFYAHSVAPAIAAALLSVASVVLIGAGVEWKLAAALAPFLLLVGLIVPVTAQRGSARAARALLAARGQIASHLTDGIQGLREVLAFDDGERRARELERLGGLAAAARARLGRIAAARRGAVEMLVGVSIALQVVLGANLVIDGSITWQQLAVALAIGIATFPSVLAVEEFVAELDQAFAAARRLYDIIDRTAPVADPTEPIAITAGGSLRFDDVTFSYGGDGTPALQDVTFDVPKGARVAVVGTSGAGKSTLVNLAVRFWDPESGGVVVGGVDARDLDQSTLRAQIAVVSQRTHLFNDTVSRNLRIANPDASQDAIEDACRRAKIHDTIVAMPQGYDTVIGEMGERLSGGQRQRLAIARALLKDAPILILDEATSELDPVTEREIQRELDVLSQGRTVLTIAHRLSTVRNADAIIAMDRGRVLERGTHEQLVAARGLYAKLWARQAGDLDAISLQASQRAPATRA